MQKTMQRAVFFRSPGLDICFEAIVFSKGLHDLKGLFKAPSAPQDFAEDAEGVVGRNHLHCSSRTTQLLSRWWRIG